MGVGWLLNALADSTPLPDSSSSAGAQMSGFERGGLSRVGPQAEYSHTSWVAVLYAPTLMVSLPVARLPSVQRGEASAATNFDCIVTPSLRLPASSRSIPA